MIEYSKDTIGEYRLTYPGYEKELVEVDKELFMYKVKGRDVYIYDGDIIFDSNGLDSLRKYRTNTKAVVTKDGFKKWPNGRVPYYFDSSASTGFINHVMDAISDIESCSQVRFVPSSSGFYNDKVCFVQSTAEVGNNSLLGVNGGTQIINIYNYNRHGIVLHEILHTLGFYHEQCRTDRDNYISINWDNIKPPKYAQFEVLGNNTSYNIDSFDLNSVMMYKSIITDTTFVYDTEEQVMFLNSNPSLEIFGGQRDSLSTSDKRGIRSMYGPAYSGIERIETNVMHSTSHYSNDVYETIQDSVYVNLRFYAVFPHQIPISLLYPRTVVIKETYVTLNSAGSLSTSTYTKTIYAPSGANTIPIKRFLARKATHNGEWTDYFDIQYEILR